MYKTACGNGFPLNIPSEINGGGGGGTGDYSDLTNKPQINDVTLSGNKSLSDIGAAAAADVSDIQDLIPSDASSTNKLATADDLPGLATTSAPGLVQPDGTSITIADGVISAVGGGGGGVSFVETGTINLSQLTWIGGTTIKYYVVIPDIFPANKKCIGGAIYGWSGFPEDLTIDWTQSLGSPTSIVLLSNKNTFAADATISLRLAYV